MLKLVSKKKDLYFKIINIKLLFVNNIEKDNRYKLKRLLDKYITSRNSKDRRKKIV